MKINQKLNTIYSEKQNNHRIHKEIILKTKRISTNRMKNKYNTNIIQIHTLNDERATKKYQIDLKDDN